MPLSLKQLQNRRDQCLEKIGEHKTVAFEIGGAAMCSVSFNTINFFEGLAEMSDKQIKDFLDVFPQLPKILDLSRQAATEEVRRRKYQADIEKKTKETAVKLRHKYQVHSKKERKAKRRMEKLKADEIDSSQELCD